MIVGLYVVYVKHRYVFPLVRTALVVASALSLVIFSVFPTAPPRLTDLGMVDTVAATTGIDLRSNVFGSFYNPIAAIPSLHFGYAFLIGLTVAAVGRRPLSHAIGAFYPAFVLLTIVATGNHFLFDAVAGAAVTMVGYLTARKVTGSSLGLATP